MSIPDYISPIIGYRVWTWDTTGLKSLCGERWQPSQSLAARCRASTVVGPSLVALRLCMIPTMPRKRIAPAASTQSKTLDHFRSAGYERFGIHGEVYLWGTVVEHELGWRAQFAYPKNSVPVAGRSDPVHTGGNGVPPRGPCCVWQRHLRRRRRAEHPPMPEGFGLRRGGAGLSDRGSERSITTDANGTEP